VSVMVAAASSGRPWTGSSRSLGILGFCIFSLLLLSPSVAGFFLPGITPYQALSALLVSIVYWVAYAALWRNPYWACLAATPLLLLTPIKLYVQLRFHSQLSPQLIGVVLETNYAEASEFLEGLWLRIFTVYILLAAVAWQTLYWMQRYKLPWALRSRLDTLGAAFVIAGLLHLFDYSPGGQHPDAASTQPEFGVAPWPQDLERVRLTSPFGDILDMVDGVEAEWRIAAVDRLNASFRFGATQSVGAADSQVYVLIIGESSRRDRWHLYGYSRQTSPRLDSESNLIKFDDVITVAPWTRASVPVILTRKPAERVLDVQFPERSLVSAFREAGFATYWLSLQQPNGDSNSPNAALAKEAEHVAYFNLTSGVWSEDTPWDGVLLEPLRKILAKPSERRQLIVLHTMGSHYNYQYRYPPEFDSFEPSLAKDTLNIAFNTQAYRSALNNTYDNSILYTDYFVSEVIAAVRSSGRKLATVTYVSDHGDSLLEAPCFQWGHAHLTAEDIRIPLLFWYSDAYRQAYPDKVAILKSHQDERLTTEAVFPLVLDAAGIHFRGEDPARSVVSESFAPLQRRLVRSLTGYTLDFDRAQMGHSCELENRPASLSAMRLTPLDGKTP